MECSHSLESIVGYAVMCQEEPQGYFGEFEFEAATKCAKLARRIFGVGRVDYLYDCGCAGSYGETWEGIAEPTPLAAERAALESYKASHPGSPPEECETALL